MRTVVLELLLFGVFSCALGCLNAFHFNSRVRCRLTGSGQNRKTNDEKKPITFQIQRVYHSQCPSSLEMAPNSEGVADVASQVYPAPAFGGMEYTSPESSDQMKSVIESVVGDWRDRYGNTLSHFRESPRSPGSAPTLAEYLRRGDFHPQELVDRLQNLKGLNVENFQRILDDGRQYVLRGVEEGESLQRAIADVFARVPVERLADSIKSFVTVLQTQGMSPESLQASLRALNMEELGVWYVGALGFVSLVAASNSSVSARKDLESRLSEATVTLGKEAEEASLQVRTLLAEKERMQSQVQELSKATATVSKELKELKAEKAQRDYAVAEMKSELRALKNELKIQKAKETEAVFNLEIAEKRLQSETQRLTSELAAKARAEKDLMERISMLQAQLSLVEGSFPLSLEKPISRPKEKAASQMSLPPDEILSEQKAEAQGVFFASVEAPVASPVSEPLRAKKKTTKKAPSTTTSALESVETKPPQKTSASRKAVSKGATGKPGVSTETKPKTDRSTPETTTVKKSSTEKVAKSTVAVSVPANDWSKLSPAAIKRKTLSELAAFLESKGLSSLGSDGKPMKKQDVVDKILDVLKF